MRVSEADRTEHTQPVVWTVADFHHFCLHPLLSLCDLGKARLCPSYRKVDAKAAASRKQVVLLPEEGEAEAGGEVAVKLEGPDGAGDVLEEQPGQDDDQQQGTHRAADANPDAPRLDW